MINVSSKLASGKAIAYDGISDILFKDEEVEVFNEENLSCDEDEEPPTYAKLTAEKLRNLWRESPTSFL